MLKHQYVSMLSFAFSTKYRLKGLPAWLYTLSLVLFVIGLGCHNTSLCIDCIGLGSCVCV